MGAEEDHQRAVLALPVSAFDDDKAIWATTLMQVADLRGEKARARALADTALVELDKQLKPVPNGGAPFDLECIGGLLKAQTPRRSQIVISRSAKGIANGGAVAGRSRSDHASDRHCQ